MDLADKYTPQVSVLGAILLEPELMGEAMQRLTDDDFLDNSCRIVWQTLCRMFRDGKTIDVVLVRNELIGFQGATEFLVQCMDAAPTRWVFYSHVDALKQQATLTRLQEIGSNLADCKDLGEAMSFLAKANNASIQKAARERRSMGGMLTSFGERHSATVVPKYLPWPLKPLNDGVKVAGGKFVVIGGYPSDGKTAFALQSAMTQAERQYRAAFYSFETDSNTAEDRAIACLAGISMESIKDNRLTDSDWAKFAQSGNSSDWPFDVVEASGMTVDDIRADALANRYQVIYIDYLQLVEPTRRNSNFSRFEEVSEISRSLQRLAKTTGITVVALSQMTRPAADKKGNVPSPTMHNLRESGQIEQDADVIMLIYRLDHKDIRAPRFLDVSKNKEGRTGLWPLDFDGLHQRFRLADRQAPPEGMPAAKRKIQSTPVLNRGAGEEYDQPTFLTGDDPNLPF